MDKQPLILECVRLGMDFYSSALSLSCTKGEIEAMENDEGFQRALEISESILE